MTKNYYKKEIVYYVYNEKDARQLKSDLYQKYDNILTYIDGITGYKIVVNIKL
jgi:hypothetical protein